MSAWIAARIDRYAAKATEPYQQREAPIVTEIAALPLIRHWFETFGLPADGVVVRWHTDGPDPYTGIRPVDDRVDWLSAVVEGATVSRTAITAAAPRAGLSRLPMHRHSPVLVGPGHLS
jgi:hypothetical protein